MLVFFKENIIDIITVLTFLTALPSAFFTYKSYKKSILNLKISSIDKNNVFVKKLDENYMNLIILDLMIENTSSTEAYISNIRLVKGDNNYISTYGSLKDLYNPNGISLINPNTKEVIRYNISSENLLLNTRIPSYGVIKGFATFFGSEPIYNKEEFEIVVDTPLKSFSIKSYVNPCPVGFERMPKLVK